MNTTIDLKQSLYLKSFSNIHKFIMGKDIKEAFLEVSNQIARTDEQIAQLQASQAKTNEIIARTSKKWIRQLNQSKNTVKKSGNT